MAKDFWELQRDKLTVPAFLVRYEKTHGSGYPATGFFCVEIVETYPTTKQIRNYSDAVYNDPNQYNGLCVYSYLFHDCENPDRIGLDVEYRQRFSCNLDQCEGMTKTLRKIEKRLEKFRQEEGTSDTPGEKVRRVGVALGIKWVLEHDETAPRGGFGYDENQHAYRWRTLVDGKDFVNWKIRQHYTTLKKDRETANR